MTKLFRTVPVSERPPTIRKYYTVYLDGSDEHFYFEWIGHWNDDGREITHVTEWLEEYQLPSEDIINNEFQHDISTGKIGQFFTEGKRSGALWLKQLILNSNRK